MGRQRKDRGDTAERVKLVPVALGRGLLPATEKE